MTGRLPRAVGFAACGLAVALGRVCAASSAERVEDFAAALEAAAASGRDIAVLLHGSDWCRPGEAFKQRVWDPPAFAADVGDGYLLVAVDHAEHLTEAQQAMQPKNKGVHAGVAHYPAIQLYDARGRLFGTYDGVADETAEALAKRLVGRRRVRIECDRLWRDAEQAEGMDKALLLGRGLEHMGLGFGHRNVFKPYYEALVKADPEDRTGYVARYGFNARSAFDEALGMAREKNYAKALALLDGHLKKPALTVDQRMQLLAGRFKVYHAWPDHAAEAVEALKAMITADPGHDMADGARGWLDYLGAQPSLAHGWKPGHAGVGTAVWTIDVARRFQYPGTFGLGLAADRDAPSALHVDAWTLLADSNVVASAEPALRLEPGRSQTWIIRAPDLSGARTVTWQLRVRAADGAGSAGQFEVHSVDFLDALPDRAVEPGVRFVCVPGAFRTLPEFRGAANVRRGMAADFALAPLPVKADFAVEYRGYFRAPADGVYRFSTTSDDGSRLWVADERVVDNDGRHGARERTGRVALRKGLHRIRAAYFAAGEAAVWEVAAEGPGLPAGPIGADRLFREAAGAAAE